MKALIFSRLHFFAMPKIARFCTGFAPDTLGNPSSWRVFLSSLRGKPRHSCRGGIAPLSHLLCSVLSWSRDIHTRLPAEPTCRIGDGCLAPGRLGTSLFRELCTGGKMQVTRQELRFRRGTNLSHLHRLSDGQPSTDIITRTRCFGRMERSV